jgi:hypothetical protein
MFEDAATRREVVRQKKSIYKINIIKLSKRQITRHCHHYHRQPTVMHLTRRDPNFCYTPRAWLNDADRRGATHKRAQSLPASQLPRTRTGLRSCFRCVVGPSKSRQVCRIAPRLICLSRSTSPKEPMAKRLRNDRPARLGHLVMPLFKGNLPDHRVIGRVGESGYGYGWSSWDLSAIPAGGKRRCSVNAEGIRACCGKERLSIASTSRVD